MNVRRSVAVSAATIMLGGGLALAAPAANAAPTDGPAVQDSWSRLWTADISGDYLKSHSQWVSQGYKQPNGSRMARGVFSCSGNGTAKLTVLNLDTGQSKSKTHGCKGDRYHVDPVSYRNGETVKLILKGSKNTKVEAWAGR